jgi:hypothetical protein
LKVIVVPVENLLNYVGKPAWQYLRARTHTGAFTQAVKLGMVTIDVSPSSFLGIPAQSRALRKAWTNLHKTQYNDPDGAHGLWPVPTLSKKGQHEGTWLHPLFKAVLDVIHHEFDPHGLLKIEHEFQTLDEKHSADYASMVWTSSNRKAVLRLDEIKRRFPKKKRPQSRWSRKVSAS